MFAMGKRFLLFALTNLLVLVTVNIMFSIITKALGIEIQTQYYTYMILFCLLWGMGGAFISLLLSKFMAKQMMGLTIIDPETRDVNERRILDMVYNMSRRAGLPKMPEVGIFESPDLNAFATGPSKSNSLVAVSTGLLANMNQEEVEGVIGHEVAHIANGDMVTMTLIQGVVNAFVMFLSRIISNVLSSQVDEKYRGVVNFALVITFDILFTILGSIVVNWFSRQREYRADLGGAKYSSRQNMIAALQKLQLAYAHPGLAQMEDDDKMDTLKISARKKGGLKALFSTHPDLADRIERLQRARI